MATTTSKPFAWEKLVIWIGALLLAFLVLIGYFYASLTVHGEEFSPDLFQTRAFSYWRLPGTKLRLSSTKLGTATSPCSKYILNHLKVRPAGTNWQVVEVSQGSTLDQRSPRILTNSLNQKNANGDSYWDDWSFRNPTRAAILWPIVQEAASMDLYVCMPDLLRTAASNLDESELLVALKLICLKTSALQPESAFEALEGVPMGRAQWAKVFASDVLDQAEIQEALAKIL